MVQARPQSKERDYKIIPVESIAVWSEANVRHTEITGGVEELAESIKQIGLLSPPLVQETDKGYKLIEGQRRLLAVKSLGWKEIPVFVVKEPYDLPNAMLTSLSENLHRKAVSPRDIAEACTYLSKRFGSDDKAAKIIGISLQTFRKYIGYQGVPEEIKKMVSEGKISVSDSLRLAEIEPDTAKAVEFSQMISEMPKPERERNFAALQDYPNDSVSTVGIRAKSPQYSSVIKIHLPEMYARAINRASSDSRLTIEAIAQKAVMDWLDRAGYVK